MTKNKLTARNLSVQPVYQFEILPKSGPYMVPTQRHIRRHPNIFLDHHKSPIETDYAASRGSPVRLVTFGDGFHHWGRRPRSVVSPVSVGSPWRSVTRHTLISSIWLAYLFENPPYFPVVTLVRRAQTLTASSAVFYSRPSLIPYFLTVFHHFLVE